MDITITLLSPNTKSCEFENYVSLSTRIKHFKFHTIYAIFCLETELTHDKQVLEVWRHSFCARLILLGTFLFPVGMKLPCYAECTPRTVWVPKPEILNLAPKLPKLKI